ncbi:hypothetical protein ACKFKG_31910 [Phormidesmis sp. 146-35]
MSLAKIDDLLVRLLAFAHELAPDLPSNLVEQAVLDEILSLVDQTDSNLASDPVEQAIRQSFLDLAQANVQGMRFKLRSEDWENSPGIILHKLIESICVNQVGESSLKID